MSRTYRKPKWPAIEYSKVAFLNKFGENFYPYYLKKVNKSLKTYEAELKKAEEEFKEAIRLNGGKEEKIHTFGNYSWTTKIQVESVRKYYFIKKLKTEEMLAKDHKNVEDRWNKYHRDGYASETSRKSGFKYEAKKKVRRANRQLEKNIVKDSDGDWNNYSYPNEHVGDHCAWNYW